jgi:CRISPR/Cas system-associated exonuclease Cas4 (RecB family)
MTKDRMAILNQIREKKDVFFKGKNQKKLFTYTPYWGKVEKWKIIETIEEIVDLTDLDFNIEKLKELWEDRQWNKEEKNKKMQEMYNEFKKLLGEKVEELRSPERDGKEMWKIADWLAEKNMLVQDEDGYTPVLEIKKETPKAYLVKTKMQLNTTTKDHEEWIPKSQIEKRIPVLEQEKK